MFTTLFQLTLQNLLYFGLHMDNRISFPKHLSKKEEAKYFEAMKNGDPKARDKLIEHNLRLVVYIVKKSYSEVRDQEDLISIGIIGLIRATETFDYEKGISFSTYASRCVDNQIKMHFRKTKRQQMEVYLNDPIEVDKDGNQITFADIFKDPLNICDYVDSRLSCQRLYSYINEVLDEREKTIICQRYGLNKNGCSPEKIMTQREIAKELGISRSYVSRIEKKALQKLFDRFQIQDE